MLKQPDPTLTLVVPIVSQTFPEGKGVETAKSWLGEFERHSGRRPSQKVKVLKLARAVKHEVL